MIRKFPFLLSCAISIVSIGACSRSEKPEDEAISDEIEQTAADLICFNHSLLVVDSLTYDAAVNSEFINKHFAFSHEKQLAGFHGFYLIGKTNYIELFNPKSIDGEVNEPGTIWMCLASLKANYLKTLNKEKRAFIEFESDDVFNSLSLVVNDSTTPITTREMRKEQYESWTKKQYHDSVEFLPVDYNSPEESDSSSNYLMNDVIGIGLSFNTNDRETVIDYLAELGFDSISEFEGRARVSNDRNQFIELYMSRKNVSISINRFYFQLNKSVERSTETIGHSRIECDGDHAIWIFE